jgi:hypothetical protein
MKPNKLVHRDSAADAASPVTSGVGQSRMNMPFIDSLITDLRPAQDVATRLLGEGPENDIQDGVIRISKRRKIGTEAYAIILYKGLSDEDIQKYERMHQFKIHPSYRNILLSINGAFLFQMSLFGIPPSMNSNTLFLDRSVLQPHDLSTAHLSWRHEFKNCEELFHFGGGPWSFTDNVGYFLDTNGKIYSVLKDGNIVDSWSDFKEFISIELERSEQCFPDHEAFMYKIRNKSK